MHLNCLRMLKLNFHHLFYFFTIANEGQVARAAKKLRIGQPTLSTQLRQFEEVLGYRLFDRRRGQTLALTTHGEILLKYAKEIFRLSDEMLAAASGLTEDGRLSLRIGVLDWVPKKEVADVISVAVKRFACFVSVFEDTASQLLASLAANKFDLIFTNAPPPHSDTNPLRGRRVAVLPVMIYGVPRFSNLKRDFPRSMTAQPLILPTAHGHTRHVLEDYLHHEGIDAQIVGEAQDGELLRRAALAGDALVPLSPSTVQQEVSRGDLVCIGQLQNVFEEVWIIAAKRFAMHPVVNYLLNDFTPKSRRAA